MKISFTTLLTVLFIGLKLAGYISWSWVWVLYPLWISAIIYVVFIGLFLALAALTGGRITVRKKK